MLRSIDLTSRFTLLDRLFALRRFVGDSKAARPTRLEMTTLEDRIVPARPLPYPVIHLGAGPGMQPIVKAIDAESAELLFERLAFDAPFTGGVNVATGDFTGDGFPDLVVAPRDGMEPRVRIFEGRTGKPIGKSVGDFLAYEAEFTGGVNLSAADVDGDGIPDVITAAGKMGGPRIRVFSGADGSVLADFFAYAPEFRGGAAVASADFTGDGKAEIVIGAGVGGGPHVLVYNVATASVISGPLGSFFAFADTDRGGVHVGTDWLTGDVTGDGVPDLVAGRGLDALPQVRVFSGATGKKVSDFLAFESKMMAGVRVATAFVDNDPFGDIVATTGAGVEGRVRVFSGTSGQLAGGPIGDFVPVEGATGGWSLSASNDPPQKV